MKIILVVIINLILSSYTLSQWFWQNPLPQGNHLMDCCFVDENNITAVGFFETITRTTDGGIYNER
jgi:hypothetical protein